MTTEVKRGPCATDRCEWPLAEPGDPRCGKPRTDRDHAIQTEWGRHAFTPHQHTIECSAWFYREFFGCDPHQIHRDGTSVCADEPDEHLAIAHPRWTDEQRNPVLPDILGSPESDASWLAMREVLSECERRTWIWVIDQWSGDSIMVQAAGLDRTRTFVGAIAALPRAVALAAWGAVSDD